MQDRNFSARVHVIGIGLLAIALVMLARLFWLQIIRHGYYKVLASSEQLHKYEVLPDRGTIFMNDRGQLYPVVLNRDLKRLYADPRYITDPSTTAQQIAAITGDDVNKLASLLKTPDTGYVVIKHGLDPDTANKIDSLGLPGIGLQDEPVRSYPEGSLGSQVLGFVNSDGEGQYGIEQQFNTQLSGQKGLLKATTDVRGIPIATADNYQIPPQKGSDIALTIDRNIQTEVEKVLKRGIATYRAKSASAVVMNPNTGAILAMANYPTFYPARFSSVADYSLFSNRVVDGAYEPGSVFKVFTMSAGLDKGVITPGTTYHDTGSVTVDGKTIKNALGVASGTHTMTDVITHSVNTGVVYVLSRLGGGTINPQAKQALYDYDSAHFLFGQLTGIDLPDEASGTIKQPSAPNIDYANMTFGQGLTATMLQIVTGYAAIANGGTLYQPYVVDALIDPNGKITKTQPKVRAKNIISNPTDSEIKAMMRTVVTKGGGFSTNFAGYQIGGKTGTAQVPDPATGGYYPDQDIGSFGGIAPLSNPRFVMLVRIDDPGTTITGFAGSGAAAPMFADIMRYLLNYSGIAPRS